MFRIPVLSRPKKTGYAPKSCRLRIDELEERCCPDGSHLTMNALVLPGHVVQLSGTVTGGQVAGVNVNFSGTVSGNTTSDSNGNYTYTTSQASLGTVNAIGVNQLMQTTDTAQATVAVTAPALSLSLSYGSDRSVTLSGKLTDIDVGGRTISFSGVAGGTVTTDSSGNFSLTTNATGVGKIDAAEIDLWAQTSNTAEVTVSDTAPVIQNFVAIHGIGNVWILQGDVVDDDAAGLVVRFGGLPALAGLTTTVRADGTFSTAFTLPPGTLGDASAITTGWLGLDSNQALYPVG